MTETNTQVSPLRPDVPLRDEDGRKTANVRHRTLRQWEQALDLAAERKWRDGSTRGDRKFTGTASAEEYARMLREGWPECLQDAEGLGGMSTDAAERLQFERSPGGVFPVVPAALAGAPDAMLAVRPLPADNVRAVTLIFDTSYNCYVNVDTVLEYAQQIMRLIAWLSANRIDTAVYSVMCAQQGDVRNIYLTPIKRSDDVLQPERIATTLHPSFLRRAWFAMVEHEYHDYDDKPGARYCKRGYGYAVDVQAHELRQLLPDAQSVVLMPKPGRGDPEKALYEALSLKLRQE